MKKTGLMLSAMLFMAPYCYGNGSLDLDDGIEFEELIDDSITLDINRSFIKASSIAFSGVSKKNSDNFNSSIKDSGTGNINVGPGVDLRGATIINLSENKGVVVSQ